MNPLAIAAKIAEGIPVEGMESLAPALLERLGGNDEPEESPVRLPTNIPDGGPQ